MPLTSRCQPRFPGVWLATGGFGNVILSLTGVLLQQYQLKVFTARLHRGSDSLELMGVQYRPELVILNSREDAKKLRVPFSSGTDLQGRQRISIERAVILADESDITHKLLVGKAAAVIHCFLK